MATTEIQPQVSDTTTAADGSSLTIWADLSEVSPEQPATVSVERSENEKPGCEHLP